LFYPLGINNNLEFYYVPNTKGWDLNIV